MHGSVLSREGPVWMRNALARIETQASLVATLKPGSNAHRIATDVLLTFQDSLHALAEAHELLERLGRRPADAP